MSYGQITDYFLPEIFWIMITEKPENYLSKNLLQLNVK